MSDLLENVIWQCLAGAQSRFSVGTSNARRYASGLSPIIGFSDLDKPDFAALAPFCQGGEHLYCAGWSTQAPGGWYIEEESTMHQMVWEGLAPEREPAMDAIRLGQQHVADVLALVELSKPGPFGPRTIELGEYFGVFDGPQLVAMAGERMQAGNLREISAICTHPQFRGRGLASQLTRKLIFRQLARGETPFLHVVRDNINAMALYERMGFKRRREYVIRVVVPAFGENGNSPIGVPHDHR